MDVFPDKMEEIRRKDGIYLYRIYKNGRSFVLKYFQELESAREIEYYTLLKNFQIPTLNILACSDRAILMEDILVSPRWRLGRVEDMNDSSVAQVLAQWYRGLHDVSGQLLKEKENWYSEFSLLTKENLLKTAQITETNACKSWSFIIEHLLQISKLHDSLDPVVNYNDFYYTNLAVGRTGAEAIMFDYNYMGKGYRAADLRNVCASLSDCAADAFRESYGPIDEYEWKADHVISMLTTLVMAGMREEFPWWAEDAVQAVKSGKLVIDLKEFLDI